MRNIIQLERSLNAWFNPRASREAKAPDKRSRLKEKQARIAAAADAAFAAGDKAKGQRLDDAAFRAWRAWSHARP